MKPYFFHINLYDAAYFGMIFISLTFAALLWFTRRPNLAANRFLAAGLVVIAMWVARVVAADIGLPAYFRFSFSLSLGPLLFFYVLKTTRPDYKFRHIDFLHFSPLLLEFTPGMINAVLPWLTFLSVIIYLYYSRKLVEDFYKRQKFQDGDRYRQEWRWLYHLLTAFGLLWLWWLPAVVAGYFYYPFYFLLLAVTIWMAARAYLIPGAGNTLPAQKPLLPVELKQKAAWLKNEVKIKRYYEDAELNLASLAEQLELTAHELSRIINAVFKKSFNDFINEYRVQAVVRKMHDPAYNHITLLGIAYGSGFNSQSTFNRIFKQMTGKSPADYKKDQPSYNLGSQARFAKVVSDSNSNRKPMLRNYFKTAWRSLVRNKSYTAINITGLAIGIAACLLIFLIVQYETSFDNFHRHKDRIYRVVNVAYGPDGVTLGSGTQLPLAEGLKLDFPNLTTVGSIMLNDGSHYSVGDTKKFKEDSAYYADPQFFQIFDFKWLAGDKKTALAEPNTMVLTQGEADKFFGDWHAAMGKMVRYENTSDFKVTGIIENTPVNSDFPMKVVMSWVTLISKDGDMSGNAQDWISTFSDHNTYLILPAGMSETGFNKDLVAFAKKHIPPPYNKSSSFQLQALRDMHFDAKIGVYSGHAFSRQLITVINLIGFFLLIIACVNFINLATAQAVNRSKEVGIRKVLGSNRFQLVLQFITETLIITLFAVVLAALVSFLTLPMLNKLLDIRLSVRFLLDPVVLLFLIGVVIGVTFFAGFYPALVLSGFNPIEALKNKIRAGRSGKLSLRSVLVVTQFCIAQFLVIGMLVLIYQMDYFKNKSLGFNKDAVVTVPLPGDSSSRTRINALRDELLQQPGIKDVSISLYCPADESGWHSDFEFDNSTKPVDFGASLKWADPEYFKLYDIPFVAGGPYKATDTISGYVVNETLIHKLGITDPKQAIGKYIMLWKDPKKKAQITGVVRDFNVGSLKDAIPPVLMAPWKQFYAKINIKIEPRNAQQTLAMIDNLWNKTFPEGVYEYKFLDKTIADFYKSENELSSLYKIFAGIALFISCLGLYGLVSFMAVQRIKEVGIRKTLGASVGQIVYLFSKEFTVLIVIAFAISAPVGFYFMHGWLEGFTYRITIGPGIFCLAMLFSLVIAWLAVGYKAVRAALTNPVKSLRSE